MRSNPRNFLDCMQRVLLELAGRPVRRLLLLADDYTGGYWRGSEGVESTEWDYEKRSQRPGGFGLLRK